MKLKRFIYSVIATTLSCVMIINMTGCSNEVQAANLMEEITEEQVSGNDIDESFINSQMEFCLELFKETAASGEKENLLISPLSVMLVLAMTANGADGETKLEMEEVLGGDISIEELNKYLYTYVNQLPSTEDSKLDMANSIWIKDDFDVNKDFLQLNANYYDADAYQAPFDKLLLDDINNWVKQNTDDMIDKIIEKHNEDAVMYLINAVTFDAEWETAYEAINISDGVFTSYDGKENSVEMMSSEESVYLDDGKATGFIKDYKDGAYSFVALLPNEDVDILDYIEEFSYDKFISTMNNAERCTVRAIMPKFSYACNITMNDILKNMGIQKGFDDNEADFTKLGQSSSKGNIFIGNVLHKTFISVDELGTKAGAVTKVEMYDKSAELSEMRVELDRPFVYMIIDNATNLPIFMGAAMDI